MVMIRGPEYPVYINKIWKSKVIRMTWEYKVGCLTLFVRLLNIETNQQYLVEADWFKYNYE